MPLALRILAALPGALFCLIAIQWLLSPGEAAHGLDLPLLSGAARSTQIGDTGAFFLGIGTCFLLGAIRLERQWFQVAALLVGGAAFHLQAHGLWRGFKPAFQVDLPFHLRRWRRGSGGRVG